MGTKWSRLEMSARTERKRGDGPPAPDLEPGVAARIADPLWILSRQWQVGELRGEDAASPVQVTATIETTPVSAVCVGSKTLPVPRGGVPVEPLVEGETLDRNSPSAFWNAAQAGLHFLRLLDAQGVGALRGDFRARYPLAAPPDQPLLGAESGRRARILARTALNGDALSLALRMNAATAIPASVTPALAPKVTAATTAFRTWYDRRFQAAGVEAWTAERMEHRFDLAAPAPKGPVVLRAEQYVGGHLDWYAFDIAPGATAPIPSADLSTFTVTTLPTPVRYRGMPAARWWEMEDGQVDLGAIAAAPTDPARLLVAEFGTISGDNWFMVPVAIEPGMLCRVREVAVRDAFGRTHPVRSVAALDGPARTWRFFEMSGDRSLQDGAGSPWLFVAPVLAGSEESAPIEEVKLVRDEGANLGFAIEAVIEDPLGHRVERAVHAARSARAPASPAARWSYAIESTVPPHWIPLVPVRAGTSAQYRLRRGRMQGWDMLPPEAAAGARGTLLRPGSALIIPEEEVPREGVRVTRSWQLARRPDGTLALWVGRRKRPGKGDARSGLRFDWITGPGRES